jgi:eukaryotic-like serine/threonine-protein kinase
MTPDEYREAADLFERLRDLPESELATALSSACGGKAELRQQVRLLLEADRKVTDESFLNRRAIEDAARLLRSQFADLPSKGTEVGNYRLGDRIGSGGMGVVYEAQDLRLQRRVAIKILPPPLAEDGIEQVKRFQQEARAASLLNHPNIVSIFDADCDRGYYYIATEFIEGRTLRQLLASEPQGLDSQTVLEVVAQTASALRAAHEAGIVHRDIKPENIMLRPDGFVKVLDFGLAKLREPSAKAANGVSVLKTRPGRLAGTIQYLSPEQVEGKPVDSRSDLFSLGVVAYELITGTRPFDGATDGAVYDAILHLAPAAPSSIRPAVGKELDALILGTLEKDPELRFQTAGDLRSSCKRLRRDSSNPDLLQAPPPVRKRSLGWKAAAAAALVCIGALSFLYFARSSRNGASAPLPVNFQRLTDNPGEENFPSLSPDGKQFVFASARTGNWDIYFQRTGGSTFIDLTRDCKDDDTQPALSPDGSRIVFRSERDGGGLFLMELTGENPRRVSQRGYLPAWAPDGRHVVYASDTFKVPSARGTPVSRLSIVDLSDGTERTLDTADAIQPNWSPHGDRIAYWGVSAGGRRDIFTIAASGQSQPVAVTADEAIDWYPVWSSIGDYLYFLSNRGGTMNIWRVGLDEHSGRINRPPEPVTVPAQYVGSLSLSSNGRNLVYSQASQRNSLSRVAFDPLSRRVIGDPNPIASEHAVSDFSFSPDGTRIVFDTLGEAPEELWIMNVDGSERRRLVSDVYRNRGPEWSPDGEEILFLSDRSGQYGIWVISIDGSGLRPLTTPKTRNMQKAIWSPDGSRVLAARSPEPAVILDPHAMQPALNPAVAPGLRDVGGIYFNDWISGREGGLAIAEWPSGIPLPEIVLYSFSKARLEHTGIKGKRGLWLKGSDESAAPYRYFVFLRESECLLYDRNLKREVRLFSSAPDSIFSLVVSPDGRSLYFTKTIRDSDLWLAQLQPEHKI